MPALPASLLTHPGAAWLMALLHACAAGLGTAPVVLAGGMGGCCAQWRRACSRQPVRVWGMVRALSVGPR